jgi:hypothetical protein
VIGVAQTSSPNVSHTAMENLYAGLVANNAINDSVLEQYDANVTYTIIWSAEMSSNIIASELRQFGSSCNRSTDCQSGMCGVGGSCPDVAGQPCDVAFPCSFPVKCCGGCLMGGDPVVETCPVRSNQSEAVTFITFDGPTTWMPKPTQKISQELCEVYQIMRDTGDVYQIPLACLPPSGPFYLMGAFLLVAAFILLVFTLFAHSRWGFK